MAERTPGSPAETYQHQAVAKETATAVENETRPKAIVNLKNHEVKIGQKTAVITNRVEWLVFLNFVANPQKPIPTQEVAQIADAAGSKKLFSAKESIQKLRVALEPDPHDPKVLTSLGRAAQTAYFFNVSEIITVAKKTNAMRQTEEHLGQPLEQILLRRYWLNGETIGSIAKDLGISKTGLSNWFDRLGIPARNLRETNIIRWQDNIYKKRLSENQKEAWRRNRQTLIAKRHTPESDSLRAKSLREYHRQHPELAQKVGETKKRNTRTRLLKKLGDNPKAILENMRLGQKIPWYTIAKNLGTSYQILFPLLTELNIDRKQKYKKAHGTKTSNDQETLVRLAQEAGLLEMLTAKQQEIIETRFLAPPNERLTLEQLGQRHDITREAIRTNHNRALAKLKKLLEAKNR